MARPKGSKNALRTKKANIDYAAIVAEKTAAKEQIETEIAALSNNISVLKERLSCPARFQWCRSTKASGKTTGYYFA